MSSETMGPVLRCARCNKPFDKESTLKRHGYYCRNRGAPPASRLRSCTACVRAKTRCDSLRPSCTRCLARDVECQYPSRTARGRANRPPSDDVSTSPSSTDLASSGIDSPEELHVLAGTDSIVNDPWNVDWNDSPVDLTTLLDVEDISMPAVPMKDIFAYPSPASLSWNQRPVFTPPYTTPTEPLSLANFSPLYTQPSASPRSLVTRSRTRPGAIGISKMILATLKSYPLMLLKHNSLPPFIHPRWLDLPSTTNTTTSSSVHTQQQTQQQEDLESLTNCITLLPLLSAPLPSNHKLFWRNVRHECTHILSTLASLSTRGLLAAMQALSLYILARVGEGETAHNNLDALLVATVHGLSGQFVAMLAKGELLPSPSPPAASSSAPSSPHHAQPQRPSPHPAAPVLAGARLAAQSIAASPNENNTSTSRSTSSTSAKTTTSSSNSPAAKWDAYIFEESKRRICTIYQVINLLVHFSPASTCGLPAEYILAPLPRRRQLWEARDALAFAAEAARHEGGHGHGDGSGEVDGVEYALASDGELVQFDEGDFFGGGEGRGRRVAKWEDWCAGMDGLGGLVVLAGSLVAS